MSTTNRANLLRLASLVRPALSNQSFIPALTHIRFTAGQATAFNNVTAVTVRTPELALEFCIPGEMLIKALNSFAADHVLIQESRKGSELVLTSGKGKLTIPTLPVKDFPFLSTKEVVPRITVTDDIIKGISLCLFSVGTDPTHPSQMGVTLGAEDGSAVLHSTDNFTISRYKTTSRTEMPADASVILPRFFCEQLLILAKAFPEEDLDLHIHAGALRVTFGKEATLFTTTIVDLVPLDFTDIIAKYFDVSALKKMLRPLPDTFDSAWSRALLVVASEQDKVTSVDVDEDEMLMVSKSAVGEATDTLPFIGHHSVRFSIDPTLVARASKLCGSIALYKRVMVLASDDTTFMHLIAHCAA